MRISEFARVVGARVEGLAEDFEILGISTLENARPGELSFVVNEKYVQSARESKASAIIVPEHVRIEGKTVIPMKSPWLGVRYLLVHFHPERAEVYFSGVHPSAVVSPEAKIGHDVAIGPLTVVGPNVVIGDRSVLGAGCIIGPDVTIGQNCYLHSNVIVEHGTRIGNRVVIQSGTVLGGDGFKFEFIDGQWVKIPQVGRVIIEDDVEIGANVTIDRASFVETRIGAGTKIDNLVQIAHNVQIGRHCVIVAQVGIAGSSSVGDGSILAAQAGVADNLTLGKQVLVMARSGVKDHLPDGAKVVGTPARPFRDAARIFAAEAKLPELLAEVAALRKKLAELEAKMAEK